MKRFCAEWRRGLGWMDRISRNDTRFPFGLLDSRIFRLSTLQSIHTESVKLRAFYGKLEISSHETQNIRRSDPKATSPIVAGETQTRDTSVSHWGEAESPHQPHVTEQPHVSASLCRHISTAKCTSRAAVLVRGSVLNLYISKFSFPFIISF